MAESASYDCAALLGQGLWWPESLYTMVESRMHVFVSLRLNCLPVMGLYYGGLFWPDHSIFDNYIRYAPPRQAQSPALHKPL